MAETAVTGSPAVLNEIRVSFIMNSVSGTIANDEILILPAMEGTQGSVTKNFERSPILRSDRQGGAQIGGTGAATATVVVPVIEEGSVKEMLASLFRGSWTTATYGAGAGTLKPGSTRQPFNLEIRYAIYDSAGTQSFLYEHFTNAEPARCTINFPTSGAATMSFEIQATAGSVDTSPISATSAHYKALAGAVPMASSITGCKFGYRGVGSAPATDDLVLLGAESLSITIDNNQDVKYRIGSASADHLTQGDFDTTMSGQVYYRNSNLNGFFVAETRQWYQINSKAGGDATIWQFHMPNGVINSYSHGTSGPTVTESVSIFGEYSADADALTKFMIIEA